MKLSGKKVLITGGAKRTGRELCLEFASVGAKLIIHCNSSVKEAGELLSELGGEKNGHKVIQKDFSLRGSAKELFSQAGRVDVLVNNASIFELHKLQDENEEDVIRQFRINFFTPLELMKEFHNQKLENGCIINFLDQRVVKTEKNGGSYNLSKKSLADATLKAALQWAPRTRVNAIAPGPLIPPAGMENSKMEKTLRQVPLGKKVSMKDLAGACIFLAENESITGQILFVDCGQHLA